MFARLSLAFVFVLGSVHAGTILVAPATANVGAGQFFEVDVDVNSITDLYAYQFDLSFNPAVLQATSITEGDFLDEGGTTLFFPGTIDNVGGTITENADSLDTAIAVVSGSGTLVEFEFEAIAPGISQNQISNVFLLDSNLEGINADIADGAVTVNIVTTPEPSCAVLVALGVVALFLRSRWCLSRA